MGSHSGCWWGREGCGFLIRLHLAYISSSGSSSSMGSFLAALSLFTIWKQVRVSWPESVLRRTLHAAIGTYGVPSFFCCKTCSRKAGSHGQTECYLLNAQIDYLGVFKSGGSLLPHHLPTNSKPSMFPFSCSYTIPSLSLSQLLFNHWVPGTVTSQGQPTYCKERGYQYCRLCRLKTVSVATAPLCCGS